jgi:uncharacterized protein
MVDHIRYDLLTQEALRGVIRGVLADAATNGLPGDHHFFITFDTNAEGVRISPRLKASYPQEMTIVLQHQFWDLVVDGEEFEVGLAFNGIPERLHVPFGAIKAFFDPSVQFGLQFTTEAEEAAASDQDGKATAAKKQSDTRPEPKKEIRKGSKPPVAAGRKASEKTGAGGKNTPVDTKASDDKDRSDKDRGDQDGGDKAAAGEKSSGSGAEVVRFDRFRKK